MSNEDAKSWSEGQKLSWSDFKGNPDPTSDAVALTASGITFGYSLKTSGKRIVDYRTTVEAHFYPNKSWYVKSRGNHHVLRHEQLHFDITELYARQFRQQLTKLVVNQNLKEQMRSLHDSVNKALNETQIRYDKQTNHSMNIEKQKAWELFVAKELKALDQFKSH
ncbi:hypothetical protein GCM10008085_27710 [Winogradskyella epiphytica]|nr:hypothetical protein GCM10008085_27710 [Winogradskyella epiphytica]